MRGSFSSLLSLLPYLLLLVADHVSSRPPPRSKHDSRSPASSTSSIPLVVNNPDGSQVFATPLGEDHQQQQQQQQEANAGNRYPIIDRHDPPDSNADHPAVRYIQRRQQDAIDQYILSGQASADITGIWNGFPTPSQGGINMLDFHFGGSSNHHFVNTDPVDYGFRSTRSRRRRVNRQQD